MSFVFRMRMMLTTIGVATIIVVVLPASPARAWSGDPTESALVYEHSTSADAAGVAELLADGSGGFYVAWQTSGYSTSTFDVRAQHYDAQGVARWTANGIVLSASGTVSAFPKPVSDGSGGTVVGWIQAPNASTSTSEIYAQRLSADGTALWGTGGIALTTGNAARFLAGAIAVSNGNTILVWYDQRSGAPGIYGQRLDANGIAQWAAGGKLLAAENSATPVGVLPEVVSDGSGGFIVTWGVSLGYPYFDIVAQRFDGSGNSAWTTSPVVVSHNEQGVRGLSTTSDGAAGVIASWVSKGVNGSHNASGVFGQRLDASGTPVWNSGVPELVAPVSANQYDVDIAGDGSGGAVFAWSDTRNVSNFDSDDVYAQRLGAVGDRQWGSTGMRLSAATGDAQQPRLRLDADGNALVVWPDARESESVNIGNAVDVYAQKITPSGTLVFAKGGNLVSDLGTATTRVARPLPDGQGGLFAAWISQPPGNGSCTGQHQCDLRAQRLFGDGTLSSVSRPVNTAPADGTVASPAPILLGSAFSDSSGALSLTGGQWRLGVNQQFSPDGQVFALRTDDSYRVYQLPFTFPFHGRSITAVSVNSDGLLELLENGEQPRLFYEPGSHQTGDFPGSDVVFAMNDDLETDDGSLKILDHGDHVVYDFNGSSYENGDSQNYPLEFQVILYQDGRIRWNFIADGVDTYDDDLYSGIYANEEATDTPVGPGTAVGNTSAFNAKSYEYDPATGVISNVPYAVDQDAFFAFGSGTISGTSSEYGVPGNAGLSGGQRYYWSYRYQDSNGYWSAWSLPTSFTADNPPSVADGSVSTEQDKAVNASLIANDADGDALTFSVTMQPAHGSVSLTDPATGAFTYTPNAGYSGKDAFDFEASDGSLSSNTATETITVTASSTSGGSGGSASSGGGVFGGFALILLALLAASIRFAKFRRDV